MSITGDAYCILSELVVRLNAYNQPDMLDGYLDGLAEEFNTRLDSVGVALIEPVYPEKKWHLGLVTYRDEVVVLDSMDRTILALPIDQIAHDLGVDRDGLLDEVVEQYIRDNYSDVLEGI